MVKTKHRTPKKDRQVGWQQYLDSVLDFDFPTSQERPKWIDRVSLVQCDMLLLFISWECIQIGWDYWGIQYPYQWNNSYSAIGINRYFPAKFLTEISIGLIHFWRAFLLPQNPLFDHLNFRLQFSRECTTESCWTVCSHLEYNQIWQWATNDVCIAIIWDL